MSDALLSDVGFKLTHIVEAQRGMTDAEIAAFFATGKKPDLSVAPGVTSEPGELEVLTQSDARAWLDGVPLTASAFLLSHASHSVEMNGETIVFKFDPSEPRDAHGRWVDVVGWVNVPPVVDGMSVATAADRKTFKEKTGKTIPPAWTDVYIADDLDNAKLLVRGKDVKGRRQSIYSTAHVEAQAEKKFTRIKQLAKFLDKVDHALEQDALYNDDAAALTLIRRLGMRPGSNRNTGAKVQAHGATNLFAKHVKVTADGRTHFDFTGKKGVHIQLETDDPLITQVIRTRLKTRKGDDRLFDTTEEKTRLYMQSTGVPEGFLLKDFRTIRANVVALQQIKLHDAPKTKTEFLKKRKEVATTVSAQLGNTPVLALSSYINPTVFTPWVQSEEWLQ